MSRFNQRAQSTLEYAVLIFVIVAALIAMQVYVKRGIQGRLRGASDEIGEQYSPGHTGSSYITTRTTSTTESRGVTGVARPGETRRDFITDVTNRSGSETVAPQAQEDWPGPAQP